MELRQLDYDDILDTITAIMNLKIVSCVIHNYFIFVSIRFTFDNQYIRYTHLIHIYYPSSSLIPYQCDRQYCQVHMN